MELLLFENSWMDVWDGHAPTEPVGAVFTKPEIVSLILDLAGYSPKERQLADLHLLEPSCGDGAFLAEIIRRLIQSERVHGGGVDWSCDRLDAALTACDLNLGFVMLAKAQVTEQLMAEGCGPARAAELAEAWIRHADFLLTTWPRRYDFVVGNPPYVRIEDLPAAVLRRYRELYPTCTDRADLYVAFFENGLRLLNSEGRLAFICANRFAKNLYGRALRQLIAREFHVRCFLNLEHTQPFASDVSAYPCVTVIDRQRGEPTFATSLSSLDDQTFSDISRSAANGSVPSLAAFPRWYSDGSPWIATERKSFDLLSALEAGFPSLEESAPGTVVGIGVATGADRVFVTKGLIESVEPECQMPLVMAGDVQPEALSWSGHYLVNPFAPVDDGSLRDLSEFPGLAAYFEKHREALLKRHVAKKRPAGWFRTIDRVTASLLSKPKLVIPDIQPGGIIGLDKGRFYPHHNVYWVTSTSWDLRVLQALLRSKWVTDQVRAHSVAMRGGSLRYQAQVLRKLRIPGEHTLSETLKTELAALASSGDQAALDSLTEPLFVP